jgi:serine/threonine protein phosphatase PrpC
MRESLAMSRHLVVATGQHSDKGRKETNQDFHGILIPREPQLSAKGIVVALADGVSSSAVSREAAEAAIAALLEDYYCTSEAWSVKKSVEHVLVSVNSWLHAQTQRSQHRYDRERGFVCTFSGIVFKSTTAYLFHVGDTRIYRLRGASLEQMTEDHRLRLSSQESFLARALGMDRKIEIDSQALPLAIGDIFLVITDGVYEFIDHEIVIGAIAEGAGDLEKVARRLTEVAFARGSADNLSVQLVRIDDLPAPESNEIYRQLGDLPFPPVLTPRMLFDGFEIVRPIKQSSRSHIFLAVDKNSGDRVVVKTPSIDQREDPAYLERFLLEEWIARRIESPHVLKAQALTRKRNFIYVVTEYVDGITLAQWMIDNPRPDLQAVRGIVDQIARGLQAFHRLEMVYQDLKPDNIMIDGTGTVKIIDFGATRVPGVEEISTPIGQINLLGAEQYAAPEYFLGEAGNARSDQFSLGVIAYQMLAGTLPYGATVPRARTKAAQKKLSYKSVLNEDREIPAWVDDAIRKAVHPDPFSRYEEISEFVFDLHHPNREFLNKTRPSLLERNPVLFWKAISFMLLLALVAVGALKTVR